MLRVAAANAAAGGGSGFVDIVKTVVAVSNADTRAKKNWKLAIGMARKEVHDNAEKKRRMEAADKALAAAEAARQQSLDACRAAIDAAVSPEEAKRLEAEHGKMEAEHAKVQADMTMKQMESEVARELADCPDRAAVLDEEHARMEAEHERIETEMREAKVCDKRASPPPPPFRRKPACLPSCPPACLVTDALLLDVHQCVGCFS
jgi:hypothetical protein